MTPAHPKNWRKWLKSSAENSFETTRITSAHGTELTHTEDCLGHISIRGRGGSNLDATVQWLKVYIGSQDILNIYIDLDEWKSAFKTELCNKIPTEFWGNE